MQTSHSTAVSKIAEGILANKVPTIVVFAHEVLGNNSGIARIVGQINHTSESHTNPQSILAGIKAAFGHKLQAIAGSVRALEECGPYTQSFTCLVGNVRESMPATQKNMKQFTARAHNMFADGDDQLWTIEKTDVGKLVVKSTGITDDLDLVNFISNSSSIPSSGQSGVSKMVAIASSNYERVKGGDFVTYADMNGTIKMAYVVATASSAESAKADKAVVLPFNESDDLISLASIIDVHDQSNFPKYVEQAGHALDAQVAVARGDFDVNMLLSYYDRIYGMHPEFYQQLSDRITQHVYAGL